MIEVFGIAAVSAMIVTYALQPRSPAYVLGFAFSCLAAAAYAALIGSLPFAVLESVWAGVATMQWTRDRRRRPERAGSSNGSTERTLPIACNLTPAQLEERKEGALADLMTSASAVARLENGYRLTLRDGTIERVMEAIIAERECCRFLDFVIGLPPDRAAATLTISGPRGTAEFLDSLLETPGK